MFLVLKRGLTFRGFLVFYLTFLYQLIFAFCREREREVR